MDNLRDKLRSMGVNFENVSNLKSKNQKKISIDQVIHGEWLESNGKRVFISRSIYPFNSAYGCINLIKDIKYHETKTFWGISGISNLAREDFLFIDTETSGLSLGTGSFVFLFGGCYFMEDGIETIQIFLEDPSQESFFLSTIENMLHKHKCLVSYNGKSFDVPILKNRMTINRISHESINIDHLDLLNSARKIWKFRLDSKGLSDIETQILKLSRTDEEVPGWLIPQIYQDFLHSKNASQLKGVFYHNEKDILSLVALFIYINEMITNKSIASIDKLDLLSIGNIFQKKGELDTSEIFYEKGLENGIPTKANPRILRDYALLQKKRKNWNNAERLWKIAVDMNDYEACIELAKYNEHQLKNYYQAMRWIDTARTIIGESNLSPIIKIELNKRMTRLQRKIVKNNEK